MTVFDYPSYLPAALVSAITDLRIDDPQRAVREASARKRRPRLTLDGRLVVIATDHPARRVTAIGDDPLAMANRHEYLARAIRALLAPGVDGIMGATDFMEDLLLLSSLLRERAGWSFLDGRVLIGCMNRGGHAGIEGEIDDRFTSFTANRLASLGFEGGKLMYRADPGDPRTIASIHDCAGAVTDLYARELAAFLEPMSVRPRDGFYETVRDTATVARDAGAAAALGVSSLRTWLKLPLTQAFEKVASATTLPILLLGGPAREDLAGMLAGFSTAMSAGSNVRGLMIGRNITFARNADPRAAAAAAAAIVHSGASTAEAAALLDHEAGRGLDELAC